MAIKKCIAVQLGVIYDPQVTNRKQGGLPVRTSLSRHTPICHLGVIHYFQPAGIHRNTTTNRWKLSHFDRKIA
jgi:hypothetical protein